MRIVEDLPGDVREIENLWIPLRDGTRLAARLWLPEDADTNPVPAVLEYLPYRKRDFTRRRDEPMHRYFAGHGYAAVRVDLRGCGDSDGLLDDEYTQQEHDDALEVIAWISSQPWCSGKVGMMGISWGGFNALQVASRRPPALAAILTLCSSDDRYADDAHYMGGCLLNENLQWGSVLLNFSAYPPDPEVVGERWREMWMRRLEHTRLFPEIWMRHQRRDDYWRHGSVCEDFGQIVCPVYAIGGWADGYSNTVPRLLQGLDVPRKGLIGPWAHAYPHAAAPGPVIGFLQEALRWWDHWLKGVDTGLMDEPMYRVWMQDSVTPRPAHAARPGRWVAESSWPSESVRSRTYFLGANTLGDEPQSAIVLSCSSVQTTGIGSGDWCAFGAIAEMPTDQRRDDGTSLTFDSPPLDTDLEILGAPIVELEVVVDRPVAMLAVRLNDIAPDGLSLRVTYGLLNLTHRDGDAEPELLVPGRPYSVRLRLNDIAHRFRAGHAVRVAISSCYWPVAWPPPEPATVSILPGGRLALPCRPVSPQDAKLTPFAPAEQAPPMEQAALRPGRSRRIVKRDLATNETTYEVVGDDGDLEGASLVRIEAIELELGSSMSRHYRISERDPLSAVAEIEQATVFRRGDWRIRVESRVTCSATKNAFLLTGRLKAFEQERCVFERNWDETIERDHV